MKKLAGLVIILAALILGGYYGTGVLTEKTIRKNINVLDQTNGLHAEVELYNRGLFRSDAQIKWQLHIPEHSVKDANGQTQIALAQDYTIDLPITIHHGPIIFTNNKVRFGLGYAETVVPFPEKYRDKFEEAFSQQSTKPQLDLSIFVNFLNESTIDFNVPTFHLHGKKDNGHFEWLGMDSMTKMSADMEKIAGSITLQGINFTKDDTKINLGKVSSDYDLHQTSAGLYLGDAMFTLPLFDVMVKGQKVFEVVGLSLNSNSDVEQHLFNTHMTIDLKSMIANGQEYGPGEVDAALRNLDAEVLARINQQTAAMQNGTDLQRQQALIALLPELPKLFSKGAEFEISKFNFKIPQGLIDGNMFVALPKGDNANPFEAIQKIHGTAKLQVPVAAVKEVMQQSLIQQMASQPELQQTLTQQLQSNSTDAMQPALSKEQVAAMQVDKQLSTLQQNGLIIVQNDNYVITSVLEQGKLVVNGKPFDSSMLKY